MILRGPQVFDAPRTSGWTAVGAPLLLLLLSVLSSPAPARAEEGGILFRDVAEEVGLEFVHVHGGSGRKYMVETMGSGVCFLDYDGDGDEDLYLVQGAPLPGFQGEPGLRNRLYRNEGVGEGGTVRFRDVTDLSRTGDTGWGMGCTSGDVDGDGDADLAVTNFGGPDVLLRNEGDGTFRDVSPDSGIADPRWSTSAAFGDADGDGHLDLYVARYVDFTVATHRPCGALVKGMLSYCHPDAYAPAADSFYRNRGDGTFESADDALGSTARGNGLGVVWSDLDDDGDPDLYVANDASPNFLFLNNGDGTFREMGLLHGASVNQDGVPEAGMGVEAADLDGDGLRDLVVTHLEMETNTLYRNLGGARFIDWSFPSGVGPPSLRHVGFGVAAIDFDHDADLDLIIANGHILDDVETLWTDVSYAEPMHLLENDGTGRYREVGSRHGPDLTKDAVGRGLALADVDLDGDQDVAVSVSSGPARLLEARGVRAAWAQIDLLQPGPNRLAVGARLAVTMGGRSQLREVRTASSYLSQNAITVHLGLGADEPWEVGLAWPDGARESHAGLSPRRRYRITRAGSPGEGGR